MDFYVYVLLDTRHPGKFLYGRWSFDYEPFYVGKGCYARHTAHFQPCSLRHNTSKNRRIKRIKRQTGDWPLIVKKKRNLSESEAFNYERQLITKIGRKDLGQGTLLNRNTGGAGSAGRIVAQDSRNKASQTVLNTLAATPKKVKTLRYKKIAEAHSKKTKKQKEKFYEKCRESNRSGDAETRRRMSLSGKARVAEESEESRLKRGKKLSKSLKAHWDTLTGSDRTARAMKAHESRDNVKIGKKIGASVAKVHASRTPEQRAAITEKIRQTLLRRNAEQKKEQR